MAPIPAEELLRMPSEDAVIELIDGEVRRWPLHDCEHGFVTAQVGASLCSYVREHGLGVTLAAGTGFILRRDPDTVRAPDVAFVRAERWVKTDEYFPAPPDLAIEVISPNDSQIEVHTKVIDWLRAGVQIVIVVDHEKQNAIIHRSPTEIDHIDINGALDAGDVVPGWTLPLRDLFVP